MTPIKKNERSAEAIQKLNKLMAKKIPLYEQKNKPSANKPA